MADNSTLMAYLVPRLTVQVENAATDALAYILNKSAGSMQALNGLLGEGGFNIEPIARVETQVTYEDGSRPDMAGYDAGNVKRLLVETKFWHSLGEGQASGYARQLDRSGPAVLLFIAPEVRIPALWVGIGRQMEEEGGLVPLASPPGMQRARVNDTERHVMLVSWVRLLDRMDALAEDGDIKSDVRQLRGLAHAQDARAFLPIHAEELSPNLGLRVMWFKQLVDDVVDSKGVRDGWMDITGLQATSQWYGHGRYVRFSDVEGYFWFGINHDLWSRRADTPLWLNLGTIDVNADAIIRELNVQVRDRWIPIHPKLGVEYEEVLDDVASQLKTVARVAGTRLPAE